MIEHKEIFIRMDQFHSESRPHIDSLNEHGKEGWIFIQVTEEQVAGYCVGTGKALFYRQQQK